MVIIITKVRVYFIHFLKRIIPGPNYYIILFQYTLL